MLEAKNIHKVYTNGKKSLEVLKGIDLKIEIQQSFRLPVTEGAADTYWAKPDGMADVVASLTVEGAVRNYSLPLIPLPYFRLKITGAVGNSAKPGHMY